MVDVECWRGNSKADAVARKHASPDVGELAPDRLRQRYFHLRLFLAPVFVAAVHQILQPRAHSYPCFQRIAVNHIFLHNLQRSHLVLIDKAKSWLTTTLGALRKRTRS